MTTHPAEPETSAKRTDCLCLRCGCVCDDVQIQVQDGQIERIEPYCPVAEAWGLRPRSEPPSPSVEGQPVAQEVALQRAVELLNNAQAPLLYGFVHTGSETQQLGVRLAEKLGALLDLPNPLSLGGIGGLLAETGASVASLGEVRQRAETIVVWAADPQTTHPRHFSRYSLFPAGRFVPEGRKSRQLIVIGNPESPTAEFADEVIPLKPGQEIAALSIVLAVLQGRSLSEARVRAQTDVELSTWQSLVEQLRQTKYGAFLFGREWTASGPHALRSLLRLANELSRQQRFVMVPLLGAGNLLGAETQFAAATGFGEAIDFSLGYPRSLGPEYSAALRLQRREIDLACVVAVEDAELPPSLSGVPSIWIAPQKPTSLPEPAVFVPVSDFALAGRGTVYRSDGVPLPIRPVLPNALPSDAEILRQLTEALD